MLSGLQQQVTLENMTSGQVIILSNLKKRNFAEMSSNGMIMRAEKDDTVELLRPVEEVALGARLYLDGDDDLSKSEIPPKLQPRKKIAESVLK